MGSSSEENNFEGSDLNQQMNENQNEYSKERSGETEGTWPQTTDMGSGEGGTPENKTGKKSKFKKAS